MQSQIHVYEENINLFWGLVGIITIAGGSYLLANAFFEVDWNWIQQIGSLILFAIGFYAIIQLTEPLYHFILGIEGQILNIEIWEGSDTHRATKSINIYDILELKIIRHTPRKENEALFDFSTNYHLLYRSTTEEVFQDLINLNGQSFTLKLKDIRKIIRLITQYRKEIEINDNQLSGHNK